MKSSNKPERRDRDPVKAISGDTPKRGKSWVEDDWNVSRDHARPAPVSSISYRRIPSAIVGARVGKLERQDEQGMPLAFQTLEQMKSDR